MVTQRQVLIKDDGVIVEGTGVLARLVVGAVLQGPEGRPKQDSMGERKMRRWEERVWSADGQVRKGERWGGGLCPHGTISPITRRAL
jgi:hypothetical protein